MQCPKCRQRLRTDKVLWFYDGKFCIHCGFWKTLSEPKNKAFLERKSRRIV